jgi:VWFA-related protein
VASAWTPASAWAEEPETIEAETTETAETVEARIRALPERYREWLASVSVLATEAEREVFLGLGEDYQRNHFIRHFWKVRDPYPDTPRNELQEVWEARAKEALELFGELTGARAEAVLTFGAPTRRKPLLCPELLRSLEVWEYAEGSGQIRGFFDLVFVGFQSRGRGPHRMWSPEEGLRSLFLPSALGGAIDDAQLAQRIARDCSRGDDVLSALAQSLDLSRVASPAELIAKPNDEWVRSFAARSTDLPSDAEAMEGRLRVDFPGRHQSRTVVQGLVAVPKAGLAVGQVGKHRSYNLVVDGEVLRKGELFDQFRYRFSFPPDVPSDEIPLVFQRYLRPGVYELIVKVEDVESGRFYRQTREIEVPKVARRKGRAHAPAATAGLAPPPDRASAEPAATTTDATDATDAGAVPAGETTDGDGLGSFARQLSEANASISTGDHSIKILALPDILTVGKLRVQARTRGEGIERVSFELDGRPVMRKSRPPYSVELDLGDAPRFHTLRVAALDADGEELANDEVTVNAGPHRFSVRLLEPRSGRRYRDSVRAHAEVQVPEGERLDRVELFLNETPVAVLYQPPFEQPMLLPESEEVTYVRAVAYLEGGNSTEDVQFINAPDFIDQLDVQLVELYTTVTDRKGDFVEELTADDFTVYEDGIRQEVRRFEAVRDLPIRAGLVLDTSLSMLADLRHVKSAAYRFFESVLTPRDRAALVTFNNEPRLAVRFTNDKEVLAGGLADLIAEGETALYDSIIFSLHYFSGLKGKRAIIVLTDGEDSHSHYNYEDAVDFARRTGVAVYVVGLNLQAKSSDVRLKMRQLTSETGGELYFIDTASQLGRVYNEIQRELRSQYLIAYQSSQGGGDPDDFRRVEVEMARKGLEAKTLRGYYP